MANSSADLYDEHYYRHYCGELPYERSESWLRFFGGVANRVELRTWRRARYSTPLAP